MEEANHWGRWLLAARRERPGEAHPADKSDELTPLHATLLHDEDNRISNLARCAQVITASQWAIPAEGRGRDGCCQPPPAQIPACGFPAPGSCLRSNVIGIRGIGYPCSSDPWAHCFSDMPSRR